MGFKDGTNNIKLEDSRALGRARLGRRRTPSRAWLRGGTYLVTRRIRMLIEVWDRASLDDQEQTIGRRKESGAPLGRAGRVRPGRPRRDGPPVPRRAHPPRRRRPRTADRRILRRGYSFTDGMDAGSASSTPVCSSSASSTTRQAFVTLQRRLARDGRAQRVHHAHGQRALRLPARSAAGRLRRRDAPRVAARPGARLTRWASPPSIRSSRPGRSPGPSPTRCRTTWAVERSSLSRSAGRASAASSSPPGSRRRRASRRRPSPPSSTSCRLRSSSWRCGSPGTTARRRLARSSSSRRAGAPGAASPERRLRDWSASPRPPS